MKPSSHTPKEIIDSLENLSFCVIDLETTGGDHKSDKIFEIGLVKLKNQEIIEEKEFQINPEKHIPIYVQKLTHVKQKDFEDKPRIENVIDEILDFIGDDIIVAHNISFDLPFLNSVLRRLEKPELQNKTLCTNILTKYLLPETTSSNLSFLSKLFNIRGHLAHRALSDAKLTAQILKYYLELMVERGIKKINHLYYPQNRFELDRINTKDALRAKRIIRRLIDQKAQFLVTLKSENGLILNSIPFHKEFMDPNFLESELMEKNVSTVSIQIFGSFLRALITYKEYFLNIHQVNREKTNSVLESFTSKHSIVSKPIKSAIIFSHHLMNHQYVAYDGDTLMNKKLVFFRYPGQEKKFVNAINKEFIRPHRKIGNHANHRSVNKIIHQYILIKQDSPELFLIYKKNFPKSLQTRKHDILDQLPSLERTLRFPKFYI